MKIFQDRWKGMGYYSFRRVGFNHPNAFGGAWLTISKVDYSSHHTSDIKRKLRNVWKLWGHHTQALTNKKDYA